MFPFLDYDVIEVTDLPNLGQQKPLTKYDSVFWNYTLGVNFYPSLADVLKKDFDYSITFKDYVISVINSAFNCQNYKRSSTAYRDMWTALTNPTILKDLKLISNEDFKQVMLNFSYESFIINQKYRQLEFWNKAEEQIGFIKPNYSEDVLEIYKGISASFGTLTFDQIENMLCDSFKFPNGLLNLGTMYNNILENNPTMGQLLVQVNLDGILSDAMYVSNASDEEKSTVNYNRIVCNLFVFICSCNEVAVSFKQTL